jgi:hypothetical protein
MPSIAYIIEFYEAGSDIPGDCYPDFVATRSEAESIAPVFMRLPTMEWAARWEIRAETIDI